MAVCPKDKLKDTIARGVSEGVIAYVAKSPKGGYDPFIFKTTLNADEIEISDEIGNFLSFVRYGFSL